MPTTAGFPFDDHPRGWYQIAWSGELATGSVRPVRYFGIDLVLFRSESGRAAVLDAHCLHMGAHLGHGGTVLGETIKCPFHAWKWDCEGTNTEIPYSSQRTITKRLRSWPIIEQSGIVFLWYDRDGLSPDFEPPHVTEFQSPDYYPLYPFGTTRSEMRIVPQLILENAIDFPHLKYVHDWNVGEPGLESYGASGDKFMIVSYGAINTARGVLKIRAETEAYGISLVYSNMTGARQMGFLSCVTPIDDERSEVFLSTAVQRKKGDQGAEPDGLAKAMIDAQAEELLGHRPGGDRDIWENMRYRTRPPLVPEEADGMRTLRSWARKFYPPELA